MNDNNGDALRAAIDRLETEAKGFRFGTIGIEVTFTGGNAVRYSLCVTTLNQPENRKGCSKTIRGQ